MPADPGLSWADTRAQLASRCDDLAEGLARLGMPAERLTTDGLVALEAALLAPRRGLGRGAVGASTAPRPRGPGAHDLLRRSAALEAVLAGLFRDGAGAPGPRGVTGRRRGRRARSWCGRWCPAPLRPAGLAAWVDGGPADPEELALLAAAETLPGRLAPGGGAGLQGRRRARGRRRRRRGLPHAGADGLPPDAPRRRGSRPW